MLEARIKAKQRSSSLVRRVHGDQVPLSFAQERLYFLDRLQPGTATYNMTTVLRLPGALDVAVLERALGEVLRRHEALRTVFREADGAPLQVVQPFAGFTLPVDDLSALGEAERRAEVARRAEAEAARPFDLAAGPLFRGRLLRLDARDHVLVMCMHHIVSDGWSMDVLRREVPALYAAFHAGHPSPLPELAVRYTDYTMWQREQAQGGILERQLAYWKRQLAGAPELLELPADHPRPPATSYRGSLVPVSFPAGLLEGLHAVARSEGATLFMVVLAAFQVLLAKYAGSTDVVVGTPIAGRTHRELEGLVGFFVNTLVLRTDLSGDPDFREVLRRVRETTLAAYENQDLPFEKLVAELQPERSLSHSPLFQVMLLMENADAAAASPTEADGDGDGDADWGESAHATAKFDLTLQLSASANGLWGTLEYSTDLFERSTMERMARHLSRVLGQLAADPGVRLSALELLDAAERATVVTEWNRTDAPFPSDACVHALFEAQAERTPDAVALVTPGGTSLTYWALNERANRLAHRLVRLGVGPDVQVGLCAGRSAELVAGMLAILKAGGAYVPLDPAYPADRLAFMAADSGIRIVLVHGAEVPLEGLTVIALEEVVSAEPAENPARGIHPANLAYVIYTSGSTGRPKAVGVPHGALANHMAWMQGAYPLAADDRVLQKTPLSFDASVWEFYAPLLAGATLVMAGPEAHRDPAELLRTVADERITILQLVPAYLRAVLETGGATPVRSLRTLFCGGEALSAELAARAADAFGCAVVNLYGPTETCIDTTSHVFSAGGAGAQVPIGRPVANTRAYVLDAALGAVPVGIPGELYIGGAQVTRGYLGRPGLTAERFVPDPFADRAGARLYRTGDRARWLADGVLEYVGRTDAQVKVRGFRIEPGEVEAVLAAHDAVREAVVIAREDAPGDRRLVGYVVAAEGAAPTPAELRAYLKGRLPEYMVPSAVVVLDALPLTPSGKVARRALPAPEYTETAYVAPRTDAERVMAEIWEAVLGKERVGVHDDFFALGGHSLMVMRLIGRVRSAFDVELSIRALFAAPTLEGISAEVERLVYEDILAMPDEDE